MLYRAEQAAEAAREAEADRIKVDDVVRRIQEEDMQVDGVGGVRESV